MSGWFVKQAVARTIWLTISIADLWYTLVVATNLLQMSSACCDIAFSLQVVLVIFYITGHILGDYWITNTKLLSQILLSNNSYLLNFTFLLSLESILLLVAVVGNWHGGKLANRMCLMMMEINWAYRDDRLYPILW